MKPETAFNIDFDYMLSENTPIELSATVQLQHSVPHYYATNFHFKNNPHTHSLLSDIDIMAIKAKDGIKWVHTDSCKETLLSAAVGKAIEAKGYIEISYEM